MSYMFSHRGILVERDVVNQQEVSVSAALRACRRVRHLLQAAQSGLCQIHLPVDLRFQAGPVVRDYPEQESRSRWELQVLPGWLAATVELLQSGSPTVDVVGLGSAARCSRRNLSVRRHGWESRTTLYPA
ncbi:uncharacterized protein LOC119770045 [Culex quinquefasciatus]|uniref:uncharacterized protein LOC119770045 n=1 Tax=Culex quinquefasciatus TaxID=7176 RepID=UPI0018E378AD|nr:uncharacterized protein LOC119770045 [Culex quinquefasciatus]